MEISISESNILDRIRKVTSSIGRTTTDKNGNSLYDTIRVISQDESLIQDYIKTAYSEVVVLLRDHVAGNIYPKITLVYSNAINDKVEKQAPILIEDFIVYTCLFMWFSSREGDISGMYSQLAQNTGSSILRCFVKQPPIKPSHTYPYILADNGTVTTAKVGDKNEIKYDLYGATDDVIFISSNTLVALITDNYYEAVGVGKTIVTVMSKHNNFAKYELNITVS